MQEQSTIGDVLSGNAAVKVEIGIDTESIIYLAAGVFVAVVLGVFLVKKLA